MNILDLQYDFKTEIEFIGDNESDSNLLTIKRLGVDGSGNDIFIEESYCMRRTGLEEIKTGLEAMLLKINDYLDEGI